MTKFNEKDVPSWARWIAVDRSGAEWAYSSKPGLNYVYNCWVAKSGRARLLYRGDRPKNWEDELYTWS